MSSRRSQDMSSRRLQHNNFSSSKTSSRLLQDVFTTHLQDVFKTSWKTKNCYAEEVLKTCSRPANVCWEFDRTGKLTLNLLIGKNRPELRNGVLSSYFFKLTVESGCFELLFLGSRFQNHPDSVILQKYESLSNQSFKHNSACMLSLNWTHKLFFELRFRIFFINVKEMSHNKQTLKVPGLIVAFGEFEANYMLQTTKQSMQFRYLLLWKEIFLVYSFSEKVAAKGNSPEKLPRDYLVNVWTCLFAYDWNRYYQQKCFGMVSTIAA